MLATGGGSPAGWGRCRRVCGGPDAGGPPRFQHPAEVLAAERLDDPLSDEVRPATWPGSSGPTASPRRWAVARPAARWSRSARGTGARGPRRCVGRSDRTGGAAEVMQVRVHGVGMHLEQLGDPGRGQVCGVEQEHLGATTLPAYPVFRGGLRYPPSDAEIRRFWSHSW